MKPILFNTDMVKAILDGRKTVTRRLIKHQPIMYDWPHERSLAFVSPQIIDGYNAIGVQRAIETPDYLKMLIETGDILYVRETWRVGAWNENTSSIAVDYKAGNVALKKCIYIEDVEEFQRYWIQSTDDAERAGLVPEPFDGQYHWDAGKGPTRWRPSIHMPKEAARIFLRVKDVRIEKLQDITVEQAKKEGAFHSCSMCIHWNDYCGQNVTLARDCKIDGIAPEFPMLWDSTIDMKNHWMDHSWSANPWVWVISFERISKEEAI